MSGRRQRREATARRAAPAASPRRGSLLADAARSARHRPGRVLAGLLLLYLLLSVLSFEPQPHTGGDNAGYITLARSLLERHTYQDLYDPAEPPHTKYPPMFPLLLAAGLALGLQPWAGLKLIGIAAGAGAIAGTFLWLRRRRRPGTALSAAFLLALSPAVLREAHWILSDVPFWCFTALALWAFERLGPRAWGRFALALLFTTLAYFTRSAGLPLVLAAALWLGWRRHWRQLAVLALVLGPLALAWWLRARAAGGVAYAGEFWLVDPYQPALGRVDLAGLVSRLGANLARYGTWHLPVLVRGLPTGPAIAAGLALVALAAFGWLRRLRRARVAELFLPLYLGLILLWPAVWAGERFLLPVLGLLLGYAGEGALRSLGRARRGLRPLAGALAVAGLALLAMPGLAENVRAGSDCTRAWRQGARYPCLEAPWREYFALAEWAGQALPAGEVVLSRKPRLFYVISGLRGRNYPMASSTEALLAAADSVGARWVVFDQLGGLAQRYLAPAILQRPQAFCMVQSAPAAGTVLFGIMPGADTTADAPAGGAQPSSFAACEQ